jgi:hypothetical protein
MRYGNALINTIAPPHFPVWRHFRGNPYRRKKRHKKSIFIYGTTFKKTTLAMIFSEARSGTLPTKKTKGKIGKIYRN